MRSNGEYWMNRSIRHCAAPIIGAMALLVACDKMDAPTETAAGPSTGSTTTASGPAFLTTSDNHSPNANPFTFVGRAGDCGTGSPAGSRIVSALWMGGMGLPDNGGPNNSPPTDLSNAPNNDDPHYGLLLSKNGNSAICASAGAVIEAVKGTVLPAGAALGFDYRNGGHCGAGAPRFNLITKDPVTNQQTFHFVGGCANGTKTPAEQDLLEWTRVRIALNDPAQTFPVVAPGSTILSLTILYDEGTENVSAEDPRGVGLAAIDNIFVNGEYIRSGGGPAFGAGGLSQSDGTPMTMDEEIDATLLTQLMVPLLPKQ
jgi:hypothetical protein